MECNKEEAARALDIAEAKIQKRDLEGARRLVQKAQRLFPSLSRIPQMGALLDVLLAAAPNRVVGSVEPDWYAVLGLLDPSVSITLIKKRYHAMALLLHPDKNASRSADEGFKLVAQAWAVLSNASTRSAYDSRWAASRGNTTCRLRQDGRSEVPRPPAEANGDGAIVFATTLCPHCKKILEVLEQLMGNLIQCKYCEKLFLSIEHIPNEESSLGGKSTKSFDDSKHGKSAEDATPERGTGPSGEGCGRSPANNIPTRKRTREKERVDYSESKPRKRSRARTKTEKVSVPDADFCSFSEELSVDKFEEGQMWALYDDGDQMPRFYAYIKHIFSKDPFKVKIQWLEAKTDESRSIAKWIDAGFYLGCGEFKLGDCRIMHGLESFSHQIFYWENTMDGNFRVVPARGEVWALYKEWNASWNGSESLETLHAYEIVEIATEFDVDAGFEVIPLAKLKNYVSVFRREKRKMVVPVHEKLRFSHSVPFKELSGDEDHRLPRNCLQLDTAAFRNDNS